MLMNCGQAVADPSRCGGKGPDRTRKTL